MEDRTRDVSNTYSVKRVLSMALDVIAKGEPAETPTDDFRVTFDVHGEEVLLTVGGIPLNGAVEPEYDRATLRTLTKEKLIDLLLE